MKKKYEDVPQYLRDFLNYLSVIKNKSSKTIDEYYLDIRTFLRFIKLYNGLVNDEFKNIITSDLTIDYIKNIQLSDLYEYAAYLKLERNNNDNTRARKISSLKTFYNYMFVKAKVIDYNPTIELESPKTKKSLPKYLTLEESINLLSVIDGEYKIRDFAIITLFLNCGLRLSELVGINISDIRDDSLYVTGKGNKERTIYLNESCVNAINDYLKIRPHDGVIDRDALFISRFNKRISNAMVQNLVKKYLTMAGLDPRRYSVHKLRHTAATLMYRHGQVDVKLLQGILGHENLSTTEIYTHVDDKQLKDAVSKNPLSDIKIKN